MSFEVADFETAYHAIFGRPSLSKFMAIPHYTYLVLKLPGPKGIITMRGDVRQSFTYEQERCELAQSLQVMAELDKIQFEAASL